MDRGKKSTRVFIGKLGNLTKDVLFEACSGHGNVMDFLMKEQYAFVEYTTVEEAERAIKDLDGRYFEETRLVAEFAKPKSKPLN